MGAAIGGHFGIADFFEAGGPGLTWGAETTSTPAYSSKPANPDAAIIEKFGWAVDSILPTAVDSAVEKIKNQQFNNDHKQRVAEILDGVFTKRLPRDTGGFMFWGNGFVPVLEKGTAFLNKGACPSEGDGFQTWTTGAFWDQQKHCSVYKKQLFAAFLAKVWEKLPDYAKTVDIREGFVHVGYWNGGANEIIVMPLPGAGAALIEGKRDPTTGQTTYNAGGAGAGSESGAGGGFGVPADTGIPMWVWIAGGGVLVLGIGYLALSGGKK